MDARSRYDDICDALTARHPDARTSKVFGMPCVKRSGRVVFGLSRTGMVFKLTDPTDHARALALPGAHLFDPALSAPVRVSGRVEGARGNREVPPACLTAPVVVPPEQAGAWEELAYTALAQNHSLTPGWKAGGSRPTPTERVRT